MQQFKVGAEVYGYRAKQRQEGEEASRQNTVNSATTARQREYRKSGIEKHSI